MLSEIELVAGDYGVGVIPGLGGALSRFTWRGRQLFRPGSGPLVTDTACFPMVPFCNRIGWGRFDVDGEGIRLKPNFPSREHPHPLHGYGWIRPWEIVFRSGSALEMRHQHEASDWPWSYVAEQSVSVTAAGLYHRLSVTNKSAGRMPAGLGLHPYMPCASDTGYHGLHRGEWRNGADDLPIELYEADEAIDWWSGATAASRPIDTVFEGREGPLSVTWPDRDLALVIRPSPNLTATAIFVSPKDGFLCVEPVSHATDAINRGPAGGVRWLEQDETMSVAVEYMASDLPGV